MERKDKIVRTLDAMKHPENFTKEELDALLSDEECVRICRDLLDSREALARRYATAPDVEAEWQSFKHRQGLCQASEQPKREVTCFIPVLLCRLQLRSFCFCCCVCQFPKNILYLEQTLKHRLFRWKQKMACIPCMFHEE